MWQRSSVRVFAFPEACEVEMALPRVLHIGAMVAPIVFP